MRRRRFIQNAGLLAAGSPGLLGAAALRSEEKPASSQSSGSMRKRVLITSAESPLAQTLAGILSQDREVRLTGRTEMHSRFEYVRSTLGHDPTTNQLLKEVDAIVHVAEPLPGENETQQIDYLTRGTYNLLWAASEEGVKRVVFLSTLELMTAYDESYLVSESWRPLPSTEPRVLSKHLGEFTCREFARENKLSVVVLRLGKVMRASDVAGKAVDPMWVEERDVASAVVGALNARLADSASAVGRWAVFHVQSDSPKARFGVSSAKSALGFKPQFTW